MGLLFVVLVFACVAAFVAFLRHKLVSFSDNLCRTMDDMLDGSAAPLQSDEEENLFYKINHRLTRLYEVLRENQESIAKERANLQELISDISHQVKTPIANLQMVNATLLEQSMPEEKRQEFLAAALGGILLNAERKNIHVSVACPADIVLAHDRKWTSEALFNILDNAVKYTPSGGDIQVSVQSWEFYVKVDITDSGKGIAENRQGRIFKRFYWEEEVHDIEGIVYPLKGGNNVMLNEISFEAGSL